MSLVGGSRAEIIIDVNGTREARRDIESVGDSMGGMGAKIGALAKSVGALAVLAGVAAFGSWIKSAIDATDAASDLSQKTGIAIKDLAGLELAYQMGGMEADALASTQSKLSKALVDGSEGLEKLGVKARNLDGSLKSNKQVMYELADRFAGMEDGAQKTALAMSLFGKSGADMIPMLNGGSEGMRELDKMAGKLGLTLSEEAVENAGNFNDTLDLLMLGGQGVARGIAAELLPTLSSLAGSFLTAMTEGDRLKTVGQLIAGVFKAIYTVGVPAVQTFQTVGKVIGGFAAMVTTNLTGAIEVLQKVAGGDFKGAWDAVKQTAASTSTMVVDVAKDVSSGWTGAWDSVVNVWADGGNKMVDTMVDIKQAAKKAADATKEQAAEAAKQAAAASKEHAAQVKVLAELSGVTATYMEDLSRLDGMRQKGLVTEKRYVELVTELIGKQPGVKAAVEAEAKARKEAAEFEERYLVARSKVLDLLGSQVAAAKEEAEQQENLQRTFGLTRTEIESLELARLEEQLAQRTSLGLTLDEIEMLVRLIAAKKRSVTAMRKMDELTGQRQMWDSIERTAHDTFVSIFDSGKSAFDRLKDTLKNGLLDLLYQMTVKKWIINVSAQGSGQGGLSDVATSLGGSGGGLGSVSSLLSVGKTIYSGFSTGLASSMGGYLTQFGNLLGSQGISAFGTGMGLTTSQAGVAASAYGAAGNTTVAGGLTAGAGAASYIPIAGWIAAGMAMADGLYKKGWDPNNGSLGWEAWTAPIAGESLMMNKVLQGLGLSGSAANLISGASIVSKIFGRKSPEVRETGLQGTVNASGFTGENYAYIVEKGGWLRSDKWSTKTAGLDAAQDAGLDATVQGMILAVKGFGAAMGLETSVINSYSKAIKLQLTDDDAKNQELIAKMFGEVGDELAQRLVPSIASLGKAGETAATTLQRVATNYAGVDAALSAIGKKFGQDGLQSVAARERLVDLFGGLDALAQSTAAYAQNFLTEAERLKPVSEALALEMGKLNLASVTTIPQFKQVVAGLDLTTEAGAKQYAAMMGLAEAFALVHPATEGAAADLASYRSALTEAYNAESAALQATITRMGSFATTLRTLRDSALLGNLSPLSPQQKYAEAKSQYDAVLAAARGGDEDAQGRYQDAYTSFLEASRVMYASSIGYTQDFQYAQAATEDAAKWAEAQVDVGQAQLDSLKASVSGLIEVNKSVLSVRDAILQFNAASGSTSTMPLTAVAPPVNTPIPYSSYGTSNTEALVAAVKSLSSENAMLRAEQRQQTGDLIRAVQGSADSSSDKISGAVKAAATTEVRVLPE